MPGALKTKSFQPLTGAFNTSVFLRPDFCHPGPPCRVYYLYREPVDAEWTLFGARPERRDRPVVDEPQPAHRLQHAVIIAQSVAGNLVVTPPHPDLDEVLAGQEFGGEVSH